MRDQAPSCLVIHGRVSMDGQRFDHFVRSVATGHTRRQVLGLLGATLAGLVPRLGQVASTTAQAATCPPVSALAQNKKSGTCDTVADYMLATGVKGKTSGYHPGYAGWTEAVFDRDRPTFEVVSFTVDSDICFKPVNIEPNFRVKQDWFGIDWTSGFAHSTCCQQERNRWTAAIQAHECHHIADNLTAVAEFNDKNYDGYLYSTACRSNGFNEAKARKRFETEIKAYVAEDLPLLRQRSKELADAFHASPDGGQITINCNKCDACTTASIGDQALAFAPDMCCAFGPPCGTGCDAECCAEGESCIDGQCQCPQACRPDECCDAAGACCYDDGGTPLGCCPAGYGCSNDPTRCCEGDFNIACPAGGCCRAPDYPTCCAGAPLGVPYNFCCPDGYACCNDGGQGGCCPVGSFSAERSGESKQTPTPEIVEPLIAGGEA
jgi:hypothetical protein